MRHRRRFLLGLLLLEFGTLRGLAFASPPDLLWVPGMYDAADYDDVVQAALGLDGLRDEAIPAIDRPVPIVASTTAPAPAVLPSTPRSSSDSRAPPAR